MQKSALKERMIYKAKSHIKKLWQAARALIDICAVYNFFLYPLIITFW